MNSATVMDFRKRIITSLSGVALIGILAFAPSALAQQIVAPLSTTPAIAERQAAAANPAGAVSSSISAPASSNRELRWGPINFRPHVSYRYLYGNGIQSSPGNPEKTEIHSFSPGLFADLGAHWTIDYTPTWTFYSSSAFRDTVNHTGQINWANQYRVWTLSAAQNFSSSDSPLAETGSQTKQTNYTTTFNALIDFNSRYALQTVLTQNLNFAEGYSNTRTWSVRDMLHRRFSTLLDTALGVDYSYTAIDRSPDMAALQFLGNLTWRPITQFNMSLEAGLEKREVYAKPTTRGQNPVYSASIQFIPVATTQLGFTASRATAASFLDNQLTDSTSFALTLNQRLLKRLRFNAALSHQEIKYTATSIETTTRRKDTIDALNLGLNTTFLTRITSGLTYQYTRNASNTPGFTYNSSQIGVEISYNF